jgi:hypothetical protein
MIERQPPDPAIRRCAAEAVCAAIAMGLLVAAAIPLAADEPELVTDRPDQTESTAIVPAGRTQVELGATYFRDDDDGLRQEVLEVPGTLVRIGLGERFELRLGWEGWLEEEASLGALSATEDGFGDAEIGAKFRLRQGGGPSPAIALIAATSVPAGEESFSTERFDPSARFSLSHDLAGGIGLGYNLGVETASRRRDHGHSTLATAIYTLAAGFPAGERWGLFAEVFGEVPMSEEGNPAHVVDGGVTYLLRPNLQLDLAAGAALSDDASDWFTGVGVSFRLPR